jgi:hypothetical protein
MGGSINGLTINLKDILKYRAIVELESGAVKTSHPEIFFLD